MFKTLKYNRGEDNGIDPVRLAKFKKLYESGEYFMHVIHVYVNMFGVIIDGHHKLALHKLFNIPVNFTILTQPEFNVGTDIQIMGAIARFNAITSKWDGKAHYNTALKLGLPLAIKIQELKAEYDTKYNLDGRILTPTRIYALLSCDKKRLESSLVSVEDYVNDGLLVNVHTEKFRTEMNFVCTVLKELQEWNVIYEETAKIVPFNMIRAAMPSVWDSELNMEKFMEEVQAVKFKNVANTVKGCIAYTKRIQTKLLKL